MEEEVRNMGEQVRGIDFQIKQHELFLAARSVDRIVQSAFFRVVWDSADAKKRKLAVTFISNLAVRNLQHWVCDDYSGYTVRELRQVASAHNVLNYCKMDKAELIHHFIEERIKDDKYSKVAKGNGANITGRWGSTNANSCSQRKTSNCNAAKGF